MVKTVKTGFRGYSIDHEFSCSPCKLSVSAGVDTPNNYGDEAKGYRQMAQNITAQIKLSDDELADKLSKADAQLLTLEKALVDLVDRWMEVAGEHRLYTFAQQLKSVTYPPCNMNTWVPVGKRSSRFILAEEISNHAFSAEVSIEEEDASWRSHSSGKVWYASYHVAVNLLKLGDLRPGHIIKSTSRRKFVDKDKAFAYIANRKAAFDKFYFTSLDPVITGELRPWFLLYGVELPGYTYAAVNKHGTGSEEEMQANNLGNSG